jgi:hypothetical protein
MDIGLSALMNQNGRTARSRKPEVLAAPHKRDEVMGTSAGELHEGGDVIASSRPRSNISSNLLGSKVPSRPDSNQSTYECSKRLNYENGCKATSRCPKVGGLALIETSGSNEQFAIIGVEPNIRADKLAPAFRREIKVGQQAKEWQRSSRRLYPHWLM